MTPMSEQEFQDFVRESNWFLRSQMDENRKVFQLDGFPRFDWDQWRGELVFSSAGTPKVVARIQLAGSHSTRSNAWSWAWANPATLPSICQSVLRVRGFGAERGIARLIQSKWAAKESDAWEMTAVTAKLTQAKGAFRCPGQDGFTYMVFTDLREVSNRRRIFGARTCSHVMDEERAILLVSRDSDGEVLAVCGGENDTTVTLRSLPLDKLLALDSSLEQLADMPDGWVAMRESPVDEWVRSKAE